MDILNGDLMLKNIINKAIMNINLEDIDLHSSIYNAVHPVACLHNPAEIYKILYKYLDVDTFIKFVLSRESQQTVQMQILSYLYGYLVDLYDEIHTIKHKDLNVPREVKHQMTLIRIAAENLQYADFLRFRRKAPAKFKPLFDKVVGEIRCGQN